MVSDDERLQARLRRLGERIRSQRNLKGLSQEQLADRAGLHRTYVGSVERGERNLGVANLWAFADALDIKISLLLEADSSESSRAG